MVNRAFAMLSRMLNLKEDCGVRREGSNPARRIRESREEEEERYLSEEEQARLGQVPAEAFDSRQLMSLRKAQSKIASRCDRRAALRVKIHNQ